MYSSNVAADMRLFSLGYSASLDRKKQYVQSMLQVLPLGFAIRWNPCDAGPELAGMAGEPVFDVVISTCVMMQFNVVGPLNTQIALRG